MEVREIMTPNPEYLPTTCTISEAARKMQELDVGFLPIGDKKTDKLVGTLTDRDIVVSCLAKGKDLSTPVQSIMHKGVLYCFENDDIKKATRYMKDHQIRRLIVLNKNKRLTGVLSLADLEKISKH
ncbi:CBS domain protein [Legionella lansingensis]|uniref:CBS domain protein n=1 Tax=Legionella lansingensis TaxID=45067 RepID=A0A0W0VH81_9GAMM|nr:CBS domain-containing protein [Legionella lansingensis]KTD19158.1 CBS domain protein [Legionella lansingensis]SNV45402.1 CBS domain protein [Legionella lansingensis]